MLLRDRRLPQGRRPVVDTAGPCGRSGWGCGRSVRRRTWTSCCTCRRARRASASPRPKKSPPRRRRRPRPAPRLAPCQPRKRTPRRPWRRRSHHHRRELMVTAEAHRAGSWLHDRAAAKADHVAVGEDDWGVSWRRQVWLTKVIFSFGRHHTSPVRPLGSGRT